MTEREMTLEEKVEAFNCLESSGQPKMSHRGTAYLVNDLYREVKRLREQLASSVEQTKQACFEAVCNQCAEGKGKGCNVCFLKSAIMQAEVE